MPCHLPKELLSFFLSINIQPASVLDPFEGSHDPERHHPGSISVQDLRSLGGGGEAAALRREDSVLECGGEWVRGVVDGRVLGANAAKVFQA